VPIHQRAGEFGLRGAGYSWKHNSMDWRKASEMLLMMLQTVKGPTILPGYMFDFWSIPYLLGKGLSTDQIAGFTRIARELLLQSFQETSPDAMLQEKQLDALFAGGIGRA
jgi:p-methyltransferase